ncbi:MAG TPA: helix-turn-helix transcriptional regulator, partial [Haloplasmataceae bacterium]
MFRPERLREWRKKRQLTQEQLAKKVNTTKGTISNYENGHSTPPHETLVALANVLGISTDYLLGLTDDPSPPALTNETLAAHRQDDPLKDLPEEARRSIEQAIETLSHRLKLARRRKKLTQRQLAALINLSPSTIALYETGKREPDLDTLRKLA